MGVDLDELDVQRFENDGGVAATLAENERVMKMARLDKTTLEQVFTYHAPGADEPPKYQAIRDAAKACALVIMDNAPECADTTVALRHVREAVMNANAAIALHGLI